MYKHDKNKDKMIKTQLIRIIINSYVEEFISLQFITKAF